MTKIITRRGLLRAILAGAAAPAIVRASSLMPIAVIPPAVDFEALPRNELWGYIRRANEHILERALRHRTFVEHPLFIGGLANLNMVNIRFIEPKERTRFEAARAAIKDQSWEE